MLFHSVVGGTSVLRVCWTEQNFLCRSTLTPQTAVSDPSWLHKPGLRGRPCSKAKCLTKKGKHRGRGRENCFLELDASHLQSLSAINIDESDHYTTLPLPYHPIPMAAQRSALITGQHLRHLQSEASTKCASPLIQHNSHKPMIPGALGSGWLPIAPSPSPGWSFDLRSC